MQVDDLAEVVSLLVTDTQLTPIIGGVAAKIICAPRGMRATIRDLTRAEQRAAYGLAPAKPEPKKTGVTAKQYRDRRLHPVCTEPTAPGRSYGPDASAHDCWRSIVEERGYSVDEFGGTPIWDPELYAKHNAKAETACLVVKRPFQAQEAQARLERSIKSAQTRARGAIDDYCFRAGCEFMWTLTSRGYISRPDISVALTKFGEWLREYYPRCAAIAVIEVHPGDGPNAGGHHIHLATNEPVEHGQLLTAWHRALGARDDGKTPGGVNTPPPKMRYKRRHLGQYIGKQLARYAAKDIGRDYVKHQKNYRVIGMKASDLPTREVVLYFETAEEAETTVTRLVEELVGETPHNIRLEVFPGRFVTLIRHEKMATNARLRAWVAHFQRIGMIV